MPYALISLTDKTGIVEFAKGLQKFGFKILASTGTKKILKSGGITCESIESLTGFPEILSGRVKTLHPKIAGAILADRSKPEHLEELEKLNISLIDIVVCNLYPFENSPGVETIDIGGVTLIRAAAKNYESVACVTSSEQYDTVLKELEEHGKIKGEVRQEFARKAFALTARFDTLITEFLGGDTLNLTYEKVMDLRYGENPHQKAALYKVPGYKGISLVNAKQLQGKELSFNNMFDIDTALLIICSFDETCACVLKHANPTGVALAENPLEAYRKARATDPLSAFGGIVGVNHVVDAELAKEITSTFIEAVLAPGYTKEALEIMKTKKNLRVLGLPLDKKLSSQSVRWIEGGILWQNSDVLPENETGWEVVTQKQPTEEERQAAAFGFKVIRFVKSNAICIAKKDQTIGIGVGQPNRVGALEIAVANMKKFGFTPEGAALASDAFFPFRDSIDTAHKAGIKCIIQPGGSIRDKEVIEACDEHGIAMLFTHHRHFRH